MSEDRLATLPDGRLVPAAINRPVAAAMPGARWHEAPGAGHCVTLRTVETVYSLCARALAP